jgi:alkylation response protein AidB-like acyl-CoA dehydrogenase
METLATLPGDDIRAIMWRYSERYDLQMLIQSARSVARGPVARAVAQGGRNTHEWTELKAELLKSFDESGITSFFMDPEHGGYIEGPKNLASALAAFELSWVDAGAATSSLAGNLALEPIHERGTDEQKNKYMAGAVPLQPGETRKHYRGAFGLTEPLPYVGVETGILSGKVSIAEWEEGKEPLLKVDKRGRFITNMDFANFACVAVTSNDDKIKGSCMIILEDTDPGIFDPGAPTIKLVHQLSSTRDPVFNLKVPASRIIGGYTVKDGVIVPNFSHGEIIEPVFKHTRVTVGLMTAAKLLSAIEPIIRYQRERFRGGDLEPDSPRYKLGIQQKEDALHRLATIWATGEAAASLGFAAARLFDELDPLEKTKNEIFIQKGIDKGRAEFKELMAVQKQALELLKLQNEGNKNDRFKELNDDPLVAYVIVDSLANVLCPATKLWNTGYGANIMREAVSLMGGYGVTEDCPGFLGQKWMDAQLEATYEGPETVQRRQLSVTMTNKVFLAQFKQWRDELHKLEKSVPEMGVSLVASALDLWLYTLQYLQTNKDENGVKLYSSSRQGVTFPMTDALCWILAAWFQVRDILELKKSGSSAETVIEGLEGTIYFFSNLAKIQAAQTAGIVDKICTELFYGYRKPTDQEIADFSNIKTNIDKEKHGIMLAKDQAAKALTQVMIPEALDYPL